MDVKIYIITHKKFLKPKIDGYYSLLVGANNNKYSECDFFDNNGENISSKNKNYCELTGLYWMWKNSNADIIGLCHYRRYFTHSYFSNKSRSYIKKSEIESLLNNYDVILPNTRYYKETVYDAVNIAPNYNDIDEVRKALKVVQPEYVKDFEDFLQGNRAYLFNMIITKKEILDKYCEWLFSILSFIEADYDISKEDPYRQRLFGFLSERLIYVWIKHNIKKEKIKNIRVVKSDEPNINTLKYDIKNVIRNFYYHLFVKNKNRKV